MKYNLEKLEGDDFELAVEIAKFFDNTVELSEELSEIPFGRESKKRDAFVSEHARKVFADFTKKTIDVEVATDSDTDYLLKRLEAGTEKDIYNVRRAVADHMKIFKRKGE